MRVEYLLTYRGVRLALVDWNHSMKKSFARSLAALACAIVLMLAGCGTHATAPAAVEGQEEAIPIKVLILPKFELGQMEGDDPGEAQYYYERYVSGGDEFDVKNGGANVKLYVKDGVALYLTGEGKVNAALSTAAVLSDPRFDFSDAYIISTGCAGASEGFGVMGDVYIISSVFDYDLGHHADSRELTEPSITTWFHEDDFDSSSYVELNPELTSRVYELVKDVPLKTTDLTRKTMLDEFGDQEWATRDPKVLRGTSCTGDNYWKGTYDHQNALLMADTYDSPDPYACSEMEDIAVSLAVARAGLLDHLIIIRDAVNMDVFMLDGTPEILWKDEAELNLSESQTFDIFPVAMENNFVVGSVVIDAILDGTL